MLDCRELRSDEFNSDINAAKLNATSTKNAASIWYLKTNRQRKSCLLASQGATYK